MSGAVKIAQLRARAAPNQMVPSAARPSSPTASRHGSTPTRATPTTRASVGLTPGTALLTKSPTAMRLRGVNGRHSGATHRRSGGPRLVRADVRRPDARRAVEVHGLGAADRLVDRRRAPRYVVVEARRARRDEVD